MISNRSEATIGCSCLPLTCLDLPNIKTTGTRVLEPGPQGTRGGEAVCNDITKQQTPIGQLFFQRKMTHFSCASASLPNFFRGFPTGAAVNRPGK